MTGVAPNPLEPQSPGGEGDSSKPERGFRLFSGEGRHPAPTLNSRGFKRSFGKTTGNNDSLLTRSSKAKDNADRDNLWNPRGFSQRATCSDVYTLTDTYRGNDFWEPSKFFFFEWGDPTGGTVQYVGKSDAQRYNLIKTTSDNRMLMYVDTTEVLNAGQGRKAVRITSQKVWDEVGF